MSNNFKTRPTHFSWGAKIMLGGFRPPGYGPVDFYTSQKTKISLRTLSAFSILV